METKMMLMTTIDNNNCLYRCSFVVRCNGHRVETLRVRKHVPVSIELYSAVHNDKDNNKSNSNSTNSNASHHIPDDYGNIVKQAKLMKIIVIQIVAAAVAVAAAADVILPGESR